MLSPFTPPTQKYHPISGGLQDDFSPQYHRSAPRQNSTACKCSHPALAPTPPLQRKKNPHLQKAGGWVVTAGQAGTAGPTPDFAVSHPSLEAVPAWASAGRSEPGLPTQPAGQPRASSREVEQSLLRGSVCTAKTTACRSGFLVLPTRRSKGLHPAGLLAEHRG